MLNAYIYVRCTEEEKAIIKAEADARDMELAPYARQKLLSATVPKKCACGLHWGHTSKNQPS